MIALFMLLILGMVLGLHVRLNDLEKDLSSHSLSAVNGIQQRQTKETEND